MIVTISGITGIGKSFFKNVIVQELQFENSIIITTRPKRKNEINGIDKIFVTDEEFEQLKKRKEILVDFEFLGSKYAYKKVDLESNKNQVTEVHYSTIYEFKKFAKNVFSIYMVPSNIEKAILELKKRDLPKEVEQHRINEINEHMQEFMKNKNLRKQFNCIFINDYTEKSKERLIHIIKEKMEEDIKRGSLIS